MLKERSRWMRARDVAAILEVSPQRVSQMMAQDVIPHYRIGKTVKVDRDEFFSWLRSTKRGPA